MGDGVWKGGGLIGADTVYIPVERKLLEISRSERNARIPNDR